MMEGNLSESSQRCRTNLMVFPLPIDGASGGPLLFYNNTVKEIQQMK